MSTPKTTTDGQHFTTLVQKAISIFCAVSARMEVQTSILTARDVWTREAREAGRP